MTPHFKFFRKNPYPHPPYNSNPSSVKENRVNEKKWDKKIKPIDLTLVFSFSINLDFKEYEKTNKKHYLKT